MGVARFSVVEYTFEGKSYTNRTSVLYGAELTNGLLPLTAKVSCLSPGSILLYSSAVLAMDSSVTHFHL